MIKFDSLSQRRYDTMQALPEFVRSDGKKPHLIGVQNNNGKCVFDCVPYAGTIAGGECIAIDMNIWIGKQSSMQGCPCAQSHEVVPLSKQNSFVGKCKYPIANGHWGSGC